jgi:2-methylaconitate cis-trans-isomerase PrpF
MRGGTSKGLFFHARDLPGDPAPRDRVILAAYGSPDPYRRQVDGLGGAISTTSKTAVIIPSADPAYDVVYRFGQVSIDRPIVDWRGNCGNMSAAVGPFAIDEALVAAREPLTRVRILQQNTGKRITAEVPVRNGRFDPEGDYAIDGVPGTGSRITLRFADPAGALTGKLFPTGRRTDRWDIRGVGRVAVTLIDAVNPIVLLRADAIGLAGTEIDAIEQSAEIKGMLEAIRCRAAVESGIAATEEDATRRSQAVPKIAVVTAPQPYTTTGGRRLTENDMDLTARAMSMGTLHRSIAVSGAGALAGAAMIPGTVAYDLVAERARRAELLRVGHPGGVIEVGAVVDVRGDEVVFREAVLGRTARRLMDGRVLVPETCFDPGGSCDVPADAGFASA